MYEGVVAGLEQEHNVDRADDEHKACDDDELPLHMRAPEERVNRMEEGVEIEAVEDRLHEEGSEGRAGEREGHGGRPRSPGGVAEWTWSAARVV